MKILYDTLGGDKAPHEIIKAALMAKNELKIEPILIGRKEEIVSELKLLNYNHGDIEILQANSRIENWEDPAISIRKKSSSSIVVGLKALRDDQADGFISAGSTGALLAGGILIIKRVEGLLRVPIGVMIPGLNSKTLLLDAGANIDTSPQILQQFAILGGIYMEKVMGIKKPSLGLLNIGSEEGKGNRLAKETHELLKNDFRINFIGNIEAREATSGSVDILIADGFDGNILLKSIEGAVSTISKLIEKTIMKMEPNLALEFSSLLKSSLEPLNYENHGGAPLIGLRKTVFKCHGSSNAQAIFNATKETINYLENNVYETIRENI